MSGTCSTHRKIRNSYTILVGKPKGNRPLVRHRRRLEDNIKIDLNTIGCESLFWIQLPQDRVQ
jgi:hypothetical protein